MTQYINGELFKKMMLNAAAAIENNKKEVNDLNVFPVPDGDTGTNMSLTISAAETALLSVSSDSLTSVADIAASALLRGARGNSGVILSLLFRGFSRNLKDIERADSQQVASALTAGVDSAYKAVMKPAEGTILTVSRMVAGAATEAAETEIDIEAVLDDALKVGYEALAETVHQNPVLQKAGVIDSGAKGYLYILDAMLRALRGEVLEKIISAETPHEKADFAQYSSEDITFTYCTEFLIERSNKKDPNQLRAFLDSRGDSVVVVDDDEIIKVHVHTNDPGDALTQGLTYGALISVKIENMREQHSEIEGSVAPKTETPPEEMKEFGFVAVCAGKGLEDVFRDLGVDRIITGGQTMNPSTDDILQSILKTPANTVYVLPNNKNIILAAQQCIPLTDKKVIVIPSRSIPQGIAAMLSIDGVDDAAQIHGLMTEALNKVHTALITTAARNSIFDGTKIKKGSHLALLNDALSANSSKFDEVITKVSMSLKELNPEFIAIYTGEGAPEREIEKVSELISSVIPGIDVVAIPGGQPVYRYIISAE